MRRILPLTALAMLFWFLPAFAASPDQPKQAAPVGDAPTQKLSRGDVVSLITKGGGSGPALDLKQPLGPAGATKLSRREMKKASSYSQGEPREGDLSFRGKRYRYVPRDPRVSETKGGAASVLYLKNQPQYR
ncbi:MAG: hypothetical protein Q7I92_14715 [Humidesulfovibrio sp.]|nr:hypothetical protein [Humidesulfovibrio sp.]